MSVVALTIMDQFWTYHHGTRALETGPSWIIFFRYGLMELSSIDLLRLYPKQQPEIQSLQSHPNKVADLKRINSQSNLQVPI